MKFIHAADLHVDSPMRGIQLYEHAPLEALRTATRRATENLVQTAIAQQVRLVLISGDLFDGKWQNVETGLWMAEQFRRLQEAEIDVCLIRGNHDAASKVESMIQWPDNVHDFSCTQAETKIIEPLGIAVHGQGFAKQAVTEDLAASYPPPVDGHFNIGMLHTSLTGSSEHESYAPTRLATLVDRGYQYWALGHIHQRSDPPLSTDPFVAFSGNTQGRHIRETGEKGVLIVEVDGDELIDVQFQRTDVLRWEHLQVELQTADDLDDLFERIAGRFSELAEQEPERWVAARVNITGACRAHSQLTDFDQRNDAIAQIRNLAREHSDLLWLEKVTLSTGPTIDLAAVRSSHDLLGQMLRDLHDAGSSNEAQPRILEALSPALDKYGGQLRDAGIDVDDAQQIATWVAQAEHLLAEHLLAGEADS